ncbi:DUF3040 domain-containing protein [Saccharopolyspora hirsuta]|uniref:DUF3040 domain-containing protein n=1 Tax=Saccharopolyspora hirsuta TaxID=1837 RepID=A0A5M7B9U0_SACHI|nr:DUF3040 domain-containing protein [Saccharopolyspora hirsuta]KAA5825490.1 DUF3040 domain-containing protein [Saccharopolyspora hirsuta]
MLRRHERRLLDEIERELCASDPEFAQKMTQVRPFTRVRAWMTLRRALGIGAVFLAVLCLMFNEGAEFFISSALAGALFASEGWKIQTE